MTANVQLNSGSGGDLARAIDRTGGVKLPLVGLDLNPNGTETLMAGFMPVGQANVVVSGSISTVDLVLGAGLGNTPTTGAPTAGSFVPVPIVNGESNILFGLLTAVGGVIVWDISTDSTDGSNGMWAATKAIPIFSNNPTLSASATGYYRVPCAGATYVRARAFSGSFSTPTSVKAIASAGVSALFAAGVMAIDQSGSGSTNAVVERPSAVGGVTSLKVLSAASTNATSVKASAGQLYGAQFSNSGAGFAFVKFYNKASSPTVGTDTVVDILAIPPGGRVELSRSLGIPFSTGIALAITGVYTDADTTNVTAGQVVGSLQYF